MNPFLPATLLLTLCHPVGIGIENCQEETIVGRIQAPTAGKVDDPIPMPDMTLVECQVLAQQLIKAWLEQHPQYALWTIRGWKCPTPEPLPSHKS